ncbi:MAG: hypothetical protein HYU59_02865 [Magnetospirillum gryphiswaldense]|nr:hypothetical protein [Magnetospirillum gryphiswaldense]
MSTVLPPSAATLTVASGGAPVVVNAVGDAKALQALAQGDTLEVVALSRSSRGMLEVMTEQGTLQLKVQPPATLPAIPQGARVLLQVGEGGLNMLAVNGRPLAGVTLPAALTANPAGLVLTPGSTAAAQAGPNLPQPQFTNAAAPLVQTGVVAAAAPQPAGITATVVRPAQNTPFQGFAIPPQPGQMPPANLPSGTQLTVRIAGIETPPFQALAGQPGSLPGQINAAQHGGGQRPVAQMPNLPQVPAQAVPPLSSTLAGAAPVLAGTVTAHPPGGQAVLSTTIGTLAVPTAENVAVGSVVRLEVVGAPQLPAVLPANTPPPRPEGLTPQGWPALSDAMETLARSDPQALDVMMRAIPSASPRLAAAMVAFTGAMKTGDGKSVVGETSSKALEKAGRRDLAERLKADLSDLAQDSGRLVGGGEWRMHSMPFVHGGVVDAIQLFVRGASADEQKRQAGGTGNDQRFILDFRLTNLGRLQMDGLVRREEKLFDLIIRTGEPLPQQMRMDIMAIFTGAAELVGTKGSVAFQSGGRWIDIRTDEVGPTRVEV